MNTNKAARLAVGNVAREGLTDIFPVPIELALLRNDKFRKKLVVKTTKCLNGNSLDSLAVGPIDHVLLPKGGPFDFRRCALIHPFDTIKYLALCLTLVDDIEKHRPSNSRRIVFSYRYRPNKGYIFNPKYNITSFRAAVRDRVQQKLTKVLVSCDIANFYDRLNLHRLESILMSLNLEKQKVRLLNELLLFWANRDSYSLPVGSNASRILAEAALIEVDNYLLSIGVRFCRFVDDYRLFAPNTHTAQLWLAELIERLWLEGLTINKSKTKIEDVSAIEPDKPRLLTVPLKQGQKKANQTIARSLHEPQFRIVAGYGGAVPTRFREPTREEKERLKEKNLGSLLRKLKAKVIVAPEDVVAYAKSVVSQSKFSAFVHFPILADMFPQLTPYLIDILIKFTDDTPASVRRKVRESFSRRLRKVPRLPEYIAVAVVSLLGSKGYEDKDGLFGFFRELSRNAGSYIGRALLDAMEGLLSRGEVLEIRRYFQRADPWEKRQIVRIVDLGLPEAEKRPWLKNVRTLESQDIFLTEQIKPSE